MLRNLIFFCLLLGTVALLPSLAETTTTAVNPENGTSCLLNPQGTNINPLLDARDCSDYYNFGRRKSGVYVIRPNGVKHCFPVYCEMEKEGGGWTVIQRRGNYGLPDNLFYKSWTLYKEGFGILDLEFWLGNDKISAITKQGKYQLRVDLIDFDWKSYNYTYGVFRVEDEVELYKLSIGESSDEEQGDMLLVYDGMRFTTIDRDNDYASDNCASRWYGAWWYRDCGKANLNGIKTSKFETCQFDTLLPKRVALRYSQLMIRK